MDFDAPDQGSLTMTDSDDDNQSYTLSIISLPLSEEHKSVTVQYELYCHEVGEHCSFNWNISPKHDAVGNSLMTPANDEMMIQHNPWVIPANDLKRHMATTGLTIECRVNVLRVQYRQYAESMLAQSVVSMRVMGQRPYIYESTGCRGEGKPMDFAVEIDDKAVRRFMDKERTSWSFSPSIFSDVFYDQWQVLMTWQVSSGELNVWIQCCGFPAATTKMAVHFEMAVITENGDRRELMDEMSLIHLYDECRARNRQLMNAEGRHVLENIMSSHRCGWIRLLCRATIVRRYDRCGNVLIEDIMKDGVAAFEIQKAPSDTAVHGNDSNEHNEMAIWFRRTLNLPQYLELFEAAGFGELEMLLDLTDSHLEKLGIDKMGHRLKILKGIRNLDEQERQSEGSDLRTSDLQCVLLCGVCALIAWAA